MGRDDSVDVLREAAAAGARVRRLVDDRRVAPDAAALAALAAFDEPLPDDGRDPADTLRLLDDVGGPATVAVDRRALLRVRHRRHATRSRSAARGWPRRGTRTPRCPPCRRWRPGCTTSSAGGWWTCCGCPRTRAWRSSPAPPWPTPPAWPRPATRCSPGSAGTRRPTGCSAPRRSTVVIGERAHSTLAKSLGLVGLGRDAGHRGARRRPGPAAGRPAARRRRARCSCARRRARSTPARSTRSTRSPTGSPSAAAGCTSTAPSGCGRWPTRPGPTSSPGWTRADSWATDGHKWLNVTYDCGIAFVRDLGDLRRTFAATAGLPPRQRRSSRRCTTRRSRRSGPARSRCGRCCARSAATAWPSWSPVVRRGRGDRRRLAAGGLTVLNDVVLNQVLVRLDDGPTTEALVAAVQADGRVWCGPTLWDGATAMRISVSSWKTGARRRRGARRILECAGHVRIASPATAPARAGSRTSVHGTALARTALRRLCLGASITAAGARGCYVPVVATLDWYGSAVPPPRRRSDHLPRRLHRPRPGGARHGAHRRRHRRVRLDRHRARPLRPPLRGRADHGAHRRHADRQLRVGPRDGGGRRGGGPDDLRRGRRAGPPLRRRDRLSATRASTAASGPTGRWRRAPTRTSATSV